MDCLGVGIARLGHSSKMIKYDTLKNLMKVDFGREPHSLVIAGKLTEMEKTFLDKFYA